MDNIKLQNEKQKVDKIREILNRIDDASAKRAILVSMGNFILKELIDFNEEKELANGSDEEYDIETFVVSKIDLIKEKIEEAYNLLEETHPNIIKELSKYDMMQIIFKNFDELETFKGISIKQKEMIKGLGAKMRIGLGMDKEN